jgi:hypothetical protein
MAAVGELERPERVGRRGVKYENPGREVCWRLDYVFPEEATRLVEAAWAHCRRINPKADEVRAAVIARRRAELLSMTEAA